MAAKSWCWVLAVRLPRQRRTMQGILVSSAVSCSPNVVICHRLCRVTFWWRRMQGDTCSCVWCSGPHAGLLPVLAHRVGEFRACRGWCECWCERGGAGTICLVPEYVGGERGTHSCMVGAPSRYS